MVITIDGPAAAGKSTVARKLAADLGFEYLDTGALYRVVTQQAMARGLDLSDASALTQLAGTLRVAFRDEPGGPRRVICNGMDVTEAIRTSEVTRNIRWIADAPAVRRELNALQRRCAQGRNVVTEGRDQGTEVFPDAAVKFYLDAPVEVRARRRLRDYGEAGAAMTLDEVMAEVAERDERDRSRPVGALRMAGGAIHVDTAALKPDEVVAMLARHVRARAREAGGA